MRGRRLVWRGVALSVIAVGGGLVGLWAVPENVTGCTGFGCNNQFPSWFWPLTCIGGLSLIWLYAAWSLLIRPIRSGEVTYGATRTRSASSRTITGSLAANSAGPVSAEGWYEDPFGAHEARWFSDGRPTILVRDGGVESHDEPPAAELDLPLVPVIESNAANSQDLRRADSNELAVAPGDAAFQAFGSSGGSFT